MPPNYMLSKYIKQLIIISYIAKPVLSESHRPSNRQEDRFPVRSIRPSSVCGSLFLSDPSPAPTLHFLPIPPSPPPPLPLPSACPPSSSSYSSFFLFFSSFLFFFSSLLLLFSTLLFSLNRSVGFLY